jgi:hypothetical protein
MAAVETPEALREYALPDLDVLKTRHRTLMLEYLRALDAATTLDAKTEKFWATWRRAVRMWVGSHIRARLLLLAGRYAQLHQACDADREEMAGWLEDEREAALAFADSLYSLRIPGLFALIPLAITVVTAATKVPGWVYGGIALSLAAYLVFIPFIVVSTFRQKREILLPGARDLDRGRTAGDGRPGRNAYKAEAELFELLEPVGRHREFSADWGVQIFVLVAALLAAYLVWVFVLDAEPSVPVGMFVLVLVINIAPAVLRRTLFRQYDRRTWR